MKFFRATAPGLVALALCLCAVPAFASEAPDAPAPDAPGTGEALTDGSDTPAPDSDNPDTGDIPAGDDGGGTAGGSYTVTCSGADVTLHLDNRTYTTVADVDGTAAPAEDPAPADTPDGSGTLPSFLRAMFGPYTPKTQTVTTYFDGQPLDVSTEYVPGLAGLDVEWLASVALFGMVVYCLFRLLGGIVK